MTWSTWIERWLTSMNVFLDRFQCRYRRVNYSGGKSWSRFSKLRLIDHTKCPLRSTHLLAGNFLSATVIIPRHIFKYSSQSIMPHFLFCLSYKVGADRASEHRVVAGGAWSQCLVCFTARVIFGHSRDDSG